MCPTSHTTSPGRVPTPLTRPARGPGAQEHRVRPERFEAPAATDLRTDLRTRPHACDQGRFTPAGAKHASGSWTGHSHPGKASATNAACRTWQTDSGVSAGDL